MVQWLEFPRFIWLAWLSRRLLGLFAQDTELISVERNEPGDHLEMIERIRAMQLDPAMLQGRNAQLVIRRNLDDCVSEKQSRPARFHDARLTGYIGDLHS